MTRATKTNAAEDRTAARARPSALGRLFEWIGRVLRLLLGSLLLSIAIEWVGMHLWWSDLGTEHSRQLVQTESIFLQRHDSVSWLKNRPAAAVMRSFSTLGSALLDSGAVRFAIATTQSIADHLNSSSRWRKLWGTLDPYLRAAGNICQLYRIRMTVLCLAAPLFMLLVWVGLVDGLVQRDLRRWGGGRESAFIYHYAKRSNLGFAAAGVIVYLAMPISIHPATVLSPFAITCALTARMTASRFKKYL